MWIIIKILIVVFGISIFSFIFSVIKLVISKKKMSIYINQINETGTIKRVYDFDLFFAHYIRSRDFSGLIAEYLFNPLPDIRNNEIYNKFKIILELKDKIDLLTIVVKFIGILLGVTVILLLILLNLYEK